MTVVRAPKTKTQAKDAARAWLEAIAVLNAFQDEVDKLAKKRGIDKVRAEIPVLNGRVLKYMQDEGMTKLDLEEDGYVNFIQATGEHVWVSTSAEITDDMPKETKSLRKLLGKDLWLRVTKRVVDPKKIEQLIEDGEITEEEVAPAHFTRKRAPYIRHVKGNA